MKKDTNNIIIVKTAENTDLEVKMKEPLALHMIAIDNIKGDTARTLNLISIISEIEVEILAALPLKEYNKLAQKLESFL